MRLGRSRQIAGAISFLIIAAAAKAASGLDYGTELTSEQKRELPEYLKTL